MARATHMPRRGFLKAIPATAAAITVPAAAQAATNPDTPVMRLFREWEALTSRHKATEAEWERDNLTNEAFQAVVDPLLEQRDQIEERMMSERCEDLRDLGAIAAVAECFDWAVGDYNNRLGHQIRSLIG